MTKATILLGLALLTSATAVVPASAEENSYAPEAIELKKLEKGKQTLDPAQGYIYLTYPDRFAGTFIRVPDEEDIAAYRERMDELRPKFEKRQAKALERWEEKVQLARASGEEPPEKPEMSFSIGAIETRTAVAVGPRDNFDRWGEDGFSYLHEVKPGRYIWYGPTAFDSQQGWVGVCYCMGTVAFNVKAGEITDLGNFLWAGPKAENQPTVAASQFMISGGWSGSIIKIPQASGEVVYGTPDMVGTMPSRKADFTAHGKMDNFYGIQISRLPEVPGVLAYERDRVIDLQKAAVAAQPDSDPLSTSSTLDEDIKATE